MPFPPYPVPERSEDLFFVLGEQHHRTSPARAERPTWLAIPERGVYTGILVGGATGSGKMSACVYPYVDPARNPNGVHASPWLPLAELIEQGKIVALNFPSR